MIISHKWKFIFVKTQKTAGTSLEIALSKYCGPSDIISPISPKDETLRTELGFQSARNYQYRISELSTINQLKAVYNRSTPKKFYNHMPAKDIRANIPADIWDNYFKFTVVRNPYDRAVSFYYHLKKFNIPRKDATFSDFVRLNTKDIINNWYIYTENDFPLVSDVVRYESLENDLGRISNHLGFPENIWTVMSSIHAKGSFRPPATGYRDVISDRERLFIEFLCEPELTHFNYSF